MGLKKMLAQGVANEQAQLSKASKLTEPIVEEISAPVEPITINTHTEIEIKPSSEFTSQEKPTNSSTDPNKPQKPEKKNQGGRPTNEEKGIKSRKQYTLTLKEDTYKMILEAAWSEDLSFAKFMERAAIEYINNHK